MNLRKQQTEQSENDIAIIYICTEDKKIHKMQSSLWMKVYLCNKILIPAFFFFYKFITLLHLKFIISSDFSTFCLIIFFISPLRQRNQKKSFCLFENLFVQLEINVNLIAINSRESNRISLVRDFDENSGLFFVYVIFAHEHCSKQCLMFQNLPFSVPLYLISFSWTFLT